MRTSTQRPTNGTGSVPPERPAATPAPDDWHRLVEALYRAEFDRLCRLAGRLLHASAAEEAVQEVFARFAVMARRPRPGAEAAYLRAMVMNEARSVLRRRQVHDRHLHRWLVVDDVGVAEMAVASDERRRVRRQLGILSERQRQVIEMRYLHQFSEREIAHRLDISPGSVKVHSCRAMTALRSSWDEAVA